MIPARFAPILFGLILSGLMTFIVSCIATVRAIGVPADFLSLWFGAWMLSWLAAFPTVLVMAPITRKLVAKLVKPG